jgi:ABC-type Fe3+-hydroxamate transport system substrate-binding protein
MMTKNIFKVLLVLLGLSFSLSCSNKNSYKSNGDKSNIRIVSLAQSVTKDLMDLGMDSSIVGATSYCDVALRNPELVIGTSTEVNIEKILLLKPDIVIATGLTSQATISNLKNNGLNVYVFPKMDSFETICQHFVELGKLVGKEELAKNIVSESKIKIDSLKKLIPIQSKKLKIFFQIGANPLFTVTPKTYMDDFITFAGCENLASDLNKGTITRESVLQRNPDIIFIVTMGTFGDEEKTTWEGYKELKAAKNKKIFIVDSEMACTPTVLSFTKTMEQIVKLVYQ